MRTIHSLSALLLIPVLLLCLSSTPPDDRIMQRSISQTVIVVATDKDGNGGKGTATHLNGGYYITARHVVIDSETSEKRSVIISDREKCYSAKIVDWGAGKTDDWAVVKCDSLELGKTRISYSLQPCTYIYRCGNDIGNGLVAAIGLLGCDVGEYWSMTISARPGASGGGVYNRQGDLLGVVSCLPVHTMGFSSFFDTSYGYFVPLESSMFDKMEKKPIGYRER